MLIYVVRFSGCTSLFAEVFDNHLKQTWGQFHLVNSSSTQFHFVEYISTSNLTIQIQFQIYQFKFNSNSKFINSNSIQIPNLSIQIPNLSIQIPNLSIQIQFKFQIYQFKFNSNSKFINSNSIFYLLFFIYYSLP